MDMIEIILLSPDEQPPDGERYLLIDWNMSGFGISVHPTAAGIRYVVGPDKHRFFTPEIKPLARRLKFKKVYFQGVPSAPTV